METKEEQVKQSVMHLRPGDGRSLQVSGELVTYKITGEQTGGAYSLFEVVSEPGGGPPPHVQHREDEVFYVLEGEYEFLMGEEALRVGKGALLYVSKGTLHAHRVVGEFVGRMLVTQTPGGLYERFFEEVGKPLDGDDAGPLVSEYQPDLGRRVVEVAAEHGIEIPSPSAENSRPSNTIKIRGGRP